MVAKRFISKYWQNTVTAKPELQAAGMSIPHSLPVLYSFRRCPYAIRARMALRYAGISVETREIALRQKPAALLAISPKATVPVLQLPGGMDGKSGGQRQFVPVLSRAAVAVGIAGIFMETHPDPDKALSDGPNAWPLHLMEQLLVTLKQLDSIIKKAEFIENQIGA